MDELVSIIIPIYNAEESLSGSIHSILAQDYENIEVILVDDGSRDNSLQICKNIASTDPRVQVIHTHNQGSGPARNVGIDHASGRYAYFPDADDTLAPHAISVMVQAMHSIRRRRVPRGCTAAELFGMYRLYIQMGNSGRALEQIVRYAHHWRPSDPIPLSAASSGRGLYRQIYVPCRKGSFYPGRSIHLLHERSEKRMGKVPARLSCTPRQGNRRKKRAAFHAKEPETMQKTRNLDRIRIQIFGLVLLLPKILECITACFHVSSPALTAALYGILLVFSFLKYRIMKLTDLVRLALVYALFFLNYLFFENSRTYLLDPDLFFLHPHRPVHLQRDSRLGRF